MNGYVFGTGPYVITATVGLSAHPDYATKYEPRARALIMGLFSILYHQRNPNATQESAGGGVSVSYGRGAYSGTRGAVGLPDHLQSIVSGLLVRRVW